MRLLIVLFGLLTIGNGAKILCVFPGAAHSHYTIGFTLMKELADRGHDVTFVSPFKEEKPIKNFKSVVLKGIHEKTKELTSQVNIFEMFNLPPAVMIFVLGDLGFMMSEYTLNDEAVQDILHNKESFDVVISEYFMSDAIVGIAYQLKAPSILMSTVGPSVWNNHIVGTPNIYSYMPHVLLGYSAQMTFFERLNNIFTSLLQNLYQNLYYLPQQNKIMHKYIPEAPDIYDLLHNTSAFLVNSDTSFGSVVPLPPNMIEIGGFHVRPPKKLPEDLQKYLDEAKDGVIYFSMGSNLKSKDIPEETRNAILRVFSKLKEKVLWKFESDLSGKPPNVEIRSWLPQQDILAHPNVKLFITHGGLLSTTESIYHGVPLIGMPVFGDQKLNMINAVNNGYGIKIPYREFTEEKFAEALNEMLNNPIYSENAKKASKIFHDKQVTPMEKAVYWVEYVIRNKGALHLKSPALDLTWYQYYSLDVILFLLLVVLASFKLFCIVIKKLLRGRRICKKSNKKEKVN